MNRKIRKIILGQAFVWLWALAIAAGIPGQHLAAYAAETAVTFDGDDVAAYRALPPVMTTEYAPEVERLLEKLENAENKEELTAILTGLRQKKEEIRAIQQEINAINIEISYRYRNEEAWKSLDAKDALELKARVELLSEYDQTKIEGYDNVLKAEKELIVGKRSTVIVVLIIAAVVVIALWTFLEIRQRRKRKNLQEQDNQ